MALKLLHLLFFMFLFLCSISHAKRDIPNVQKLSPFEFIKQLKGCHKGVKAKGIHQLKSYFQEFGYLKYVNQTHANDDDFDDVLEFAVKTYQENYHIEPTGILDDKTITKLSMPRCGVPDIINGTNTMRANKKRHNTNSIHEVSHYSFFTGTPRWPPSKTHLTYGFLSNTPQSAVTPIANAFQKWAANTHFTFSRAPKNQNPDLIIGFQRSSHGDGAPFDGPGGTIAHAFAPTDGRFHYDADERWSTGPVQNAYNLETVALHEIGHLLGLGHSSVEEAIMYPEIASGVTKSLHEDDIQGIRDLYDL